MSFLRFAPLVLALLAFPAIAHDGAMPDGCPADRTFTAGDITVSGAFTRAMLSGARVGAGYLTIVNAGDDDRLVAVRSEASERIELHEMAVENDMMRMSEVEGGILLRAGETVTLEPGGLHIMFMAPNQEFQQGECVAVTLVFEQVGELDVQLSVGPVGASGPSEYHHGYGHDHDHDHDHDH